MRISSRSSGRILARAGLVLVGAAVLAGSAQARPAGAALAAPATPVWPAPELVTDLRLLLLQYYNQTADAATAAPALAPRYEAEKAAARKDPDTLWEFHGGPGTACHGAVSQADFITCAGRRLAATFNRAGYAGGLTLFEANRDYYELDAYARIAGYYALYHAFLHDFDAPIPAASGFTQANARDAQAYHRAMVRAYEAHMRDIMAKMFRDTRSNAYFQTSLSRAGGYLALAYAPVVTFMERHQIWGANRDRRNAFAVIDAMNQRLWWEWVWTQSNGPLTAGFVNLGSESTYMFQRPGNGVLDGTDVFRYDFGYGPQTIPSLRPVAADTGPGGTDGMWFDADYTTPGEWWCFGTFAGNPTALARCKDHASRISRAGLLTPPGPYTPYGQFYGNTGQGVPCDHRAYANTGHSCGQTNLGSVAEEWLWTFAGARAGLYIIERLAVMGDPDLPASALGKPGHQVAIGRGPVQSPYANVSDRLGYGVSGFHGGAGFNDDLEWTWGGDGRVRAVRTLSAARHDLEPQNGRYSVGEADVAGPPLPPATGIDGDAWSLGRQEYPGAIENHLPGPSALYGTALFNLLLSDQTADRTSSASGLAPSLFDATHRNHVEEFRHWVWLFQSSYYRCPNPPGDDPIDPACFAIGSAQRKALFAAPNPASPSLRFDYLWRDTAGALDPGYLSNSDPFCAGGNGVPWRKIHNRDTAGDATYMHDEIGFGAYNEILQGTGGLMRVLAERYPLNAGDPAFAQERSTVIKPWYDEAYALSEGIIDLYGTGYGYVPDIENSTCMGSNPDPGDPSPAMISWQQGTGASVQATTVRRAMWYSIATLWYWWYDSGWMDAEVF